MRKKELTKNEKIRNVVIATMAIGIIITAIGFIFMIKDIVKYQNYNIVMSNVINYKVKTEGTGDKINKTSYLYTLSYTVNNKTYTSVLNDYIEEEYHYNDEIKIISEKEKPESISLYQKDDTGIIVSVVGIVISTIGLLSHIFIVKKSEK